MPLGGLTPPPMFPSFALAAKPEPEPEPEPEQVAPQVEPEPEPKQAEAVEPKQIESDEMRTARIDSARIQIAAMEAKAWDAVHQQPKIDQLQQELDDMKHRTKSLDEIVTMLTEALGEEL